MRKISTRTAFQLLAMIILIVARITSYAQPANDNFASAIDLTASMNSCSGDAAFTTLAGTPDLNPGSCWNNSGPQHNVWFSFVAATSEIEVIIDVGGTKGNQGRTQLAIWRSNGTTEVGCRRYVSNSDDVGAVADTLTIGQTYYISVDVFNASYDGTFTLCVYDQIGYDFLEGAVNLTDSLLNNSGQWCSPDAQYTTIGGTRDQSAGSCWNNSGPQFNRWFSFVAATSRIQATVNIGGSQGTQQRTQLALWRADGSAEVACKRYSQAMQMT